jgi:hypothetical protein
MIENLKKDITIADFIERCSKLNYTFVVRKRKGARYVKNQAPFDVWIYYTAPNKTRLFVAMRAVNFASNSDFRSWAEHEINKHRELIKKGAVL